MNSGSRIYFQLTIQHFEGKNLEQKLDFDVFQHLFQLIGAKNLDSKLDFGALEK